ncbi:MAG TPA: hypothetical protein VJ953_05360 [Saprospiraceae bacterium]|nr:hypothetical protein [Saprospiraceae bacterium]
MDKQRAKITIKKINSLFDSIEMETNGLSTIERDLMLKYIRDLYEVFVDEAREVSPPKKMPPKPISPPKPEAPAPPRPIIESKPMDQPKFDLHKKNEDPAEKEPEAPQPEPVYSAPRTSASGTTAEIEALFTFQEARELSEKLSEQPIRDLQAALSINDKLLYTNELFGRQHNVLNDSLSTLNRFENMEQARSFLVSLAEQYNWTEAEREEIARSFIKTIRRRYV